MNPQEQVCHNRQCGVYGRKGEGHIVIHSQKERRYRCKRCGKTFSATKDTALYRIHHPHALLVTVVTLLAWGCPVQAVVAAFALDERTVADWQRRAGDQCQRVQGHLVQAGQVTPGQVQADEVWVRAVGAAGARRAVWLAMAISVTSRLWLGGVVRERRDRHLIAALLRQVRACGAVATLLLCTDGLVSYPRQAMRVFRQAVYTQRRGRPRWVLPDGLLIAQRVKRYAKGRVTAVARRVVRGCGGAVAATLLATQGTATITTAHIERLNATFRARLAPLARRSRATVHRRATLERGMWVVGAVYNCCTPHRSLAGQTPAQAAGLTDHRWTLHELLTFPVPLPAVRHRGRPPTWLREIAHTA